MFNIISTCNDRFSFSGNRYNSLEYKQKSLNCYKIDEKYHNADSQTVSTVFSLPYFINFKNSKISFKSDLSGNICVNSLVSPSLKADSDANTVNLAKEYRVQLNNNSPWFEARKGRILQPSEIPESTLLMIAQKSLKDMEEIPKDKTLYIVSGRIGCGKTTFVQKQKLGEFCYTPDCDDIKPFLPGYKDKDSSYVHLASSSILAANLYEAFNRGLNVVFQTSTEEQFLDVVLDKAKKCGYKNIVMFHINTSEENSINRANKRATETGRYVRPEVIKSQKYIDDLVSIYKNRQKGLSKLIVYDNNSKDFVEVQRYSFDGKDSD